MPCLLVLLSALVGAPPSPARPQLVRAAPIQGEAVWSPRRLFNAALEQEEHGNPFRAVQLFLASRLSDRASFADELYARGAGLRLVRILAGYDDDAATAAALLVAQDAGPQASTDLAPLLRTLLRRFETTSEFELMRGIVAEVRWRASTGTAILEVDLPGEQRRVVFADGPVGPFTAGDAVKILARKDPTRVLAAWRLVALGHADQDGWQILAVSGLPGTSGSVAVVSAQP